MRCVGCVVLAVALFAPLLAAGQIYGTIRENGRGVAKARVDITCGKNSLPGVETAGDGGYRIFVKDAGRCDFRVTKVGSPPASATIFSYADPVKYDFDLLPEKGGGYSLRGK